MNKDSAVIIVLFLVAVVFFGLSFYIPTLDQSIEIYQNRLGARFFPQFLLCGIMILSLIVIYIDYRKSKNNKSTKGSRLFSPEVKKRILSIFILVLGFGVIFDWLGAFLSIFIFVFFYLWNWGIKKLHILILTPTCVALGIYLVFTKLLSVRLPLGIFETLF